MFEEEKKKVTLELVTLFLAPFCINFILLMLYSPYINVLQDNYHSNLIISIQIAILLINPLIVLVFHKFLEKLIKNRDQINDILIFINTIMITITLSIVFMNMVGDINFIISPRHKQKIFLDYNMTKSNKTIFKLNNNLQDYEFKSIYDIKSCE